MMKIKVTTRAPAVLQSNRNKIYNGQDRDKVSAIHKHTLTHTYHIGAFGLVGICATGVEVCTVVALKEANVIETLGLQRGEERRGEERRWDKRRGEEKWKPVERRG